MIILKPLTALHACILANMLMGGEVIFGPQQSSIEVHVPKAGLLKAMGHEHTIVAREFSAAMVMEGDIPQSIHVTVPVNGLTVTDPHLDEESRQTVRTTMYSDEVLSGEKHPLITYESASIEIESEDLWNLTGRLTVAGQTSEMPLTVEVSGDGENQFRASGKVELSLHDFGIRPVSAMGGMIRTGKTVTVSFEFISEPSMQN